MVSLWPLFCIFFSVKRIRLSSLCFYSTEIFPPFFPPPTRRAHIREEFYLFDRIPPISPILSPFLVLSPPPWFRTSDSRFADLPLTTPCRPSPPCRSRSTRVVLIKDDSRPCSGESACFSMRRVSFRDEPSPYPLSKVKSCRDCKVSRLTHQHLLVIPGRLHLKRTGKNLVLPLEALRSMSLIKYEPPLVQKPR